MMSISKKSKVVDIKAAIANLGFKAPNLKKDDLLLYYKGALRMKQENIQETKVDKELILDYTPLYMREGVDYQTHLVEYGWCVIQVKDFPLEEIRESFFSWLERACPRFIRGDKSTWLKKNMPYVNKGIFKQYIGQTEFCWRMRESVYPAFATLWGEEDLLTSFDGGCFLTGEKNIDYKNWMHCDQSRREEDFVCVQGIVNLYDSGEEDGGTLLLEGSHKCFSSYLQQHPVDGLSAFFPIDPFCPTLSSCRVVKPCLKAGELLLFDSRVFHCNVAPKGEQPRMCLYVSMAPRRGADDKLLQKRIQTYEKGRMTGHWCYGDGFVVCPEHAHHLYSKGFPVPELEIADCNTKLRRRLVGY